MSDFKFKHFAIAQDRTAMKVGTDGVLLGSWVEIIGTEQNILDIGTGTGLIAIMRAQRSSAPNIGERNIVEPNIVGVEIDTESAQQAGENMSASPWSERLTAQLSSIQNYTPQQKFDLILSNPPYFVDSLLSKGKSRSVARHTTELSFDELLASVARLLSPDGRFAVILPTVESKIFETLAREYNLHPMRRCLVRGKVNGEVKRIMSEYSFGESFQISEYQISKYQISKYQTSEHQIAEHQIAIRDTPPGDYSAEYKAMTADFYIKF